MKGKPDFKRIILIGIPLLLIAVGVKFFDDETRVLWFEKNETDHTSARFFLFSGEKERILKAHEGGTAEIIWTPEVERGSLTLEVRPPAGEDSLVFGGESRTCTLELEKGERVRLTVRADRAKGSFTIEWKTP
ncbi:MAG: hypothetical protein ACLFNZ_04935 [Spirochaetaceae bacterium]